MVGGADGRWHPSIGDPTIGGWITVFACFGAALLAYRTLRLYRRNLEGELDSSNNRSLVRFWLLVTSALVLLGINKQLDLQSWFTEVGRDIAHAQGWYEERRSVQALFVVALGVLGLTGMVALLVLLRHLIRQVGGALFGLSFLLTFVAIRAASFHHIDQLLKFGIVHLNWVLELGGIACIALSAWRQSQMTSSVRGREQAESSSAVSPADHRLTERQGHQDGTGPPMAASSLFRQRQNQAEPERGFRQGQGS